MNIDSPTLLYLPKKFCTTSTKAEMASTTLSQAGQTFSGKLYTPQLGHRFVYGHVVMN